MSRPLSPKTVLLAKLATSPVHAAMEGGPSLDEWPDICGMLKQEGWTENPRTGTMTAPGEGSVRYMMRPQLHRRRLGTMVVQAAKYVFNWTVKDTYGNPSSQSSSGGLRDLEYVQIGGIEALQLTMWNGAKMFYSLRSVPINPVNLSRFKTVTAEV